MKTFHYTYISFDESGRRYHGVRSCHGVTPWEDEYMGSYKDQTFQPIGKHVQKTFSCRRTAERFESWFQVTADVAGSSEWVNQINAPCGWSEKCATNSVEARMGKTICINSEGKIKFMAKCKSDWKPYRRDHDKGKTWWTNKSTGKKMKAFECPGEEWIKAGNNTTGTKWWRHEVTGERKRSKECPGEGWTNKNARNETKGSKGKLWAELRETGEKVMIDASEFDPATHKKSGPNANKSWRKDPVTGKRIYSQ